MGTALGAVAFVSPAFAAPAPAGALIQNQAIATFESGGQQFTATSNMVTMTINTVPGVDIADIPPENGSPGGKITIPGKITNVGNAPDSYTVTTTPGGPELTPVGIYPDANCDGTPDALTPLTTTPSLNPGEDFCVVAEFDVASNVTPGTSATFDLTVTGTLSPTPTDTETGTVNFTDTAILKFTKSMTLFDDVDGSGSITPGDLVRVRLTYRNNGLEAGTNIVIEDPLPPELIYDDESGVWSDGGTMTDASGNTDHTNGQGDTIDYSYDAGTNTINAVISSVPVGREGAIQFMVEVDQSASGSVENIATIDSDQTDETPSNPSTVDVDDDDSISLTLGDSSTTDGVDDAADLPDGNLGGSIVSNMDDGATNDDIVSVTDSVAEGSVVTYELVLENHSGTDQRFNLEATTGGGTAGSDPFPAGTTFNFFSETGAPLFDTGSDGYPDIAVPAGSVRKFQVRADLPSGVQADLTIPEWQGLVTATSVSNPLVSNSTIIELAGYVIGAVVDLENAGGLADGQSVDNGGAPWTTVAINPGEMASFTLVVQNDGMLPDSFNLAYSDANSPFSAGSLPSGWRVVLKDSSGAVVTNTGVIAAGGSATFTAEVTTPDTEVPGDFDLFFRAMSATNAAVSDVKMDRVTISQMGDLELRTNRTATTSPNGVVDMSHTLANVGNVGFTSGALVYSTPFVDFKSTLYVDVNGNGQLDSADLPVDDIADILAAIPSLGTSFDPGESVTLISRVSAPSVSLSGLSETAVLEIQAAGDTRASNNTVSETVTLVSGDLEVVKEQALDADCNGTEDAAFTQAAMTADPGDCILYRVTATNTGSDNAENVQIDDEVPAYTVLSTAATATGGDNPQVDPALNGSTGPIRSTHGTLQPSGVATLTFGVRIDE